MLFNSFSFLIFFPVVTILYFLLPHRLRWVMLLMASCVFYMFFIPVYILILFFTIIIDYFAGILIENENNQKKKKVWLVVSLVANIGILAVFKYYNFFISNFNDLATSIGWNYSVPMLSIILPIGLSFHTFQAMSYTIEVFRGNQKAERHFGIYALYVMYYPQLVAGPIERPQNLLWQFHKRHSFDYSRVTSGLKLMAWGFFKKVVIADRLSVYVTNVFDAPLSYSGMAVLIAVLFFTIQIYCDFSGYSDIAIGASRVMGIQLMENFRQPYFSSSVSEFWKRWHISLSTWFKDYVYIPLGGNRKGKLITYRNLFITFLISGFWHGANWTFIIWGAIHGFYLIFGLVTSSARLKISSILRLTKFHLLTKLMNIGIVFFLVAFAWIFFRAESIDHAGKIIKWIIIDTPNYFQQISASSFSNPLYELGNGKSLFNIYILLIALAILVLFDILNTHSSLKSKIYSRVYFRWPGYILLLLMILFFGVYHADNEFIYFQF